MKKKNHSDDIVIVGASEHNLKNVSLTLPRNSLTVFTGVSGSGKSSLAFDTIFKEGQRRFVESLSSYARQFLGQTDKPKVEHVEGLSPTISVDQKTVNRNPRSTVGTITEIYDHYRLLFARLGTPHCPQCGTHITSQTPAQITDHAYVDALDEPSLILAPMVRERKGEYRKELEEWLSEGYLRARVDGEIRRLDEDIQLARYEKHSIELVIDRLTLVASEKSRFTEGVEKALQLSKGLVIVNYRDEDHLFSQLMACPSCQIAIPEMEPRLFSFNAPQGACPTCNGLGTLSIFKEEKLCDPEKSIKEGTFRCFSERGNILFTRIDQSHINALNRKFKIDDAIPWKDLPKEQRDLILHGNTDIPLGISNVFRYRGPMKKRIQKKQWPGIIAILQFVARFARAAMEKFQDTSICPDCEGKRLNPMALAVKFYGHNIDTLSHLAIEESHTFFDGLDLNEKEKSIGRDIFREIKSRLKFLNDVGVGYLNLNRSAATLSGGEGQRIRLASQLGAGLQGVLYVLDEPSIGLHQSDNQKLIHTLKTLRDRGNTVFVVEHDEETISEADHIVDIGPTAGKNGGHITAQGTMRDIIQVPESVTGSFLSGDERIDVPEKRRIPTSATLSIHKASLHNLQEITANIPLGVFVAIAGVSGSGKSSLIDGILKKALSKHLNGSKDEPGPHEKITGLEHVDRVIEINQSPIGRTPRSNPATYTKVFDGIRDLFALVPESKARGYKKGRFSFNVKGGRCEDCKGAGIQTIEMQFLSDVQIPCDACQGKRFNAETLQIYYKGKNIYEILEMTVDEASEFFSAIPKIYNILKTLQDVGLGYIHLGQPSTTLSGGEAQRVKLASELRKKATGQTLYILDEPTTGLHFQDIRILLKCLNALVEQGNTVLVIEHNLDVLKVADHIIELGPGGGKYGGHIICEGSPEKLGDEESITGKFLAPVLKARPFHQQPANNKKRSVSSSDYSRDIIVKGASKNNLRHIDVRIPVNKMTVITGVSGSGKTSLAFDTIFAEGQARYVESLSTYARRFLGRMDKAPVDSIDGLAPAIAINQKSTSRNPRSTVATTTEIYDYFRLLYARIGIAHCPHCDAVLEKYTPTRAGVFCADQFDGRRVEILAPLFRPKSGKILLLDSPQHFKEVVGTLRKDGFLRAYINDKLIRLDDWEEIEPGLHLKASTTVDLVIDRLLISQEEHKRLVESLETAFQRGHGLLKLRFPDHNNEEVFLSERLACVPCDFYQEEELIPRMFSFNSHVGACQVCDGLGKIDHGRSSEICSSCDGERLKPQYRAVRINGKNITQFCEQDIETAREEINHWKLSENDRAVAEQALQEIVTRLEFLLNVGLGYLTLDQATATLSGGETQRIRLASQIGSGLVGVMYVLDEPTIGLHPRDTERLLNTLTRLRDLGNTVILVEHDLETIKAADHIIDIGPGAGHYGGQIVTTGTPKQIERRKNSLTGQYLNGEKSIPVPSQRRSFDPNKQITVYGAKEHNLRDINVSFPIGVFNVVTGVSGSGKSSLVVDVLQKALFNKFYRKRGNVGKHSRIKGIEEIDKMMVIDQEPIGRTPRSNPASYTKVLGPIRELFAKMPQARQRGYTPRRFSFNAKEGRCPSCEGQGKHLIEMHFLSDVWIDCDECKGQRYNRETLSVTFRGHTIADVLNLEINQAVELFENQPRILRICKTLQDVGLGYMKLGQAGNTLSGGESQRLKLSAELAKRSTGNTLYILDEPTTGLHIEDVARLLKVLHRLVDDGNTVIVIEHNPEVIKTADYLIDMGPEGGINGGNIVFSGAPEEIIHCPQSHTGRHLASLLT